MHTFLLSHWENFNESYKWRDEKTEIPKTQIKELHAKCVTLCLLFCNYCTIHRTGTLFILLFIFDEAFNIQWARQMFYLEIERKSEKNTHIRIINMLYSRCCSSFSVGAFDFPLIHMPVSFISALLIYMIPNSFNVDFVRFSLIKISY